MQGSDLEDVVRKEKTCRFWPGPKGMAYLAGFFIAVVIGGNAILNSARPSNVPEHYVAGKNKKRVFYERWIYHGEKTANDIYEKFFGGSGTQPVEKRDGYLTKD